MANGMMTQGNTQFIAYISGAGEQWQACLKDFTITSTGEEVYVPFHHEGPGGQSHDDLWINYKAQDGNYWWAKCLATLTLLGISFGFEQYHDNTGSAMDHFAPIIGFITWDGTKWVATVPGDVTTNLKFNANPQVLG